MIPYTYRNWRVVADHRIRVVAGVAMSAVTRVPIAAMFHRGRVTVDPASTASELTSYLYRVILVDGVTGQPDISVYRRSIMRYYDFVAPASALKQTVSTVEELGEDLKEEQV